MADYANNDYMIAWDTKKSVKVGPWPDKPGGWSAGYSSTSGCCYAHYSNLPESEQATRLVYLAAQIMFEGVPPEDVLREFYQIRVWREMPDLLPSGMFDRFIPPGHSLR